MSKSSMSVHDASVRARPGRDGKRTAQKAVLEARQRLTSSSGTRADFDFELMHDYADSRIGAAMPMAAIVSILAIVASFWVPLMVTTIWAGLVISSLLVVVVTARRFKSVELHKFNAARWTTSFVAAESLGGLALSLLALFTLVTDPEALAPVMFAMVLVSIASNAIATHTLPPATLMSTLPVTTTVSISLIALGGTLNYTLAAVSICGEIFFVYLARQLHNSELETITHQAEKDTLIYELEEARNMSDEARRHAEQANIAKSQFLATMSHELRTPLNAIIGFSEVLKSELLGPHQVPQYKEYAGDIHASGQHLLNLINELLDLSRIEAGKYELNEEVVSLVDIADDCRRMMELRAKSKNIELVFSVGDNLPRLWGDERAIRQVVLNLLSNAIKFTPQQGKIVLVVQRSGDGGQLISVKDNGPGIPESEIATVLSSFGQGSLAQKTAEQGAGLGLPIVQKIMDLHQGRFDLFSKLRFGTEVIATFPRARVMDALAPVVEKRNRLEIYSEAG
ncbi:MULTISPECIES: sensor histidine kinase [Devosia]|uniref:sensor histidine kinase n=1 Tax=Devosia TaxID=46913 RepID=UPI001FE321CC|nr:MULTISPECIES: HAMP domain-containing sensor histidine kinase [Devosia]